MRCMSCLSRYALDAERGVASLQAREGSKKEARKMSIGSEKGGGESSCEVGSEVEKQG